MSSLEKKKRSNGKIKKQTVKKNKISIFFYLNILMNSKEFVAGLYVNQVDVDDISESSLVGQYDVYGSCGLTKIRMKGI